MGRNPMDRILFLRDSSAVERLGYREASMVRSPWYDEDLKKGSVLGISKGTGWREIRRQTGKMSTAC